MKNDYVPAWSATPLPKRGISESALLSVALVILAVAALLCFWDAIQTVLPVWSATQSILTRSMRN